MPNSSNHEDDLQLIRIVFKGDASPDSPDTTEEDAGDASSPRGAS
jgi:hypothetical protein